MNEEALARVGPQRQIKEKDDITITELDDLSINRVIR
jgi:hypothetical protein